tara:strand:- start:777 stop:1310 length:534 start_codon:yes stop_codon:yes gene_type:complete
MAKTSDFVLTERLEVSTSGTPVNGTIDLGAYIDVGDSQGVMIKQIDFIWQGVTSAGAAQALSLALGGNGVGQCQVFDLNRGGTEQFADDNALVASGQLNYGNTDNNVHNSADIFPDRFGRPGGRVVINDNLYVTTNWTGSISSNEKVSCTVLVTCAIVKLSKKDFMALAISSSASSE